MKSIKTRQWLLFKINADLRGQLASIVNRLDCQYPLNLDAYNEKDIRKLYKAFNTFKRLYYKSCLNASLAYDKFDTDSNEKLLCSIFKGKEV